MTSRSVPIFDGHNDVLLRLYRKEDAAKAFMEGDGKGQLDFPAPRRAILPAGCLRFSCRRRNASARRTSAAAFR